MSLLCSQRMVVSLECRMMVLHGAGRLRTEMSIGSSGLAVTSVLHQPCVTGRSSFQTYLVRRLFLKRVPMATAKWLAINSEVTVILAWPSQVAKCSCGLAIAKVNNALKGLSAFGPTRNLLTRNSRNALIRTLSIGFRNRVRSQANIPRTGWRCEAGGNPNLQPQAYSLIFLKKRLRFGPFEWGYVDQAQQLARKSLSVIDKQYRAFWRNF